MYVHYGHPVVETDLCWVYGSCSMVAVLWSGLSSQWSCFASPLGSESSRSSAIPALPPTYTLFHVPVLLLSHNTVQPMQPQHRTMFVDNL